MGIQFFTNEGAHHFPKGITTISNQPALYSKLCDDETVRNVKSIVTKTFVAKVHINC